MTGLLIALLWVFAAFLTLGTLLTIASIGKPRKPLESRVAVFVVIIDAAVVGTLISAALAIAAH